MNLQYVMSILSVQRLHGCLTLHSLIKDFTVHLQTLFIEELSRLQNVLNHTHLDNL